MFNIVRKNNNKVVAADFTTLDDANKYLQDLGPQRNFLKVVEVISESIDKALAAVEKVKKPNKSALSNAIIEVLTQEKPLACKDIATRINEQGLCGDKVITTKMVCDRIWLLARRGQVFSMKTGYYTIL